MKVLARLNKTIGSDKRVMKVLSRVGVTILAKEKIKKPDYLEMTDSEYVGSCLGYGLSKTCNKERFHLTEDNTVDCASFEIWGSAKVPLLSPFFKGGKLLFKFNKVKEDFIFTPPGSYEGKRGLVSLRELPEEVGGQFLVSISPKVKDLSGIKTKCGDGMGIWGCSTLKGCPNPNWLSVYSVNLNSLDGCGKVDNLLLGCPSLDSLKGCNQGIKGLGFTPDSHFDDLSGAPANLETLFLANDKFEFVPPEVAEEVKKCLGTPKKSEFCDRNGFLAYPIVDKKLWQSLVK